MSMKPKGDKGPQKTFRAGDIKIKIDTKAAEKAAENLRKMFDQMREKLMQIFLEWLKSKEGQAALRKAIREELRK